MFEAKAASATRAVAGRPVYFCCAACAEHFDAHRAAIVQARKLE